MLRSLITPTTNCLQIDIPDNYIGKKVEVLVFTYEETQELRQFDSEMGIMANFWGVVSTKTTDEMHQHVSQSRAGWEKDI